MVIQLQERSPYILMHVNVAKVVIFKKYMNYCFDDMMMF